MLHDFGIFPILNSDLKPSVNLTIFFAEKYDLMKVAHRDRQSRYPLMPMDEAITTVLKCTSQCETQTVKDIQGGDVYLSALPLRNITI